MIRAAVGLLFGSIKYWLTLLFLVVLTLAVGIVYIYTVRETETRLVNERLTELKSSAPLIQESLYASLHPDPKTGRITYDRQTLEQQVGSFDSQLNARIVVVSPSNSLIVDSRGTPAFFVADYPLIYRARTAVSTELGTVTVDGISYAVAAVPISRPGRGVVGEVVVLSSLKDVDAAVAAVKRELTLAALFAVIVALVTIVLASRLISQRLKRIERSAQVIATGDFEAGIEVGVKDEIGRLGLTFNKMGRQLRSAFEQLEAEKEQVTREKEQVDLLLSDLTEGVIGLAPDGEILVVNPSAVSLLGIPAPRGQLAQSVLPADLVDAWRECRESGCEVTRVIERGATILEATAYHVGGEPRIDAIVVVRDATEQVRLDRARRDFAASASHELKTPLFSLAGLLELIAERELDDATRGKFLGLMKQQIDRLTTVSGRLLDLSRIESGAALIQRDEADLVAVVRRTLAEAAAGAAPKGVLLDLQTTSPALPLVCDERHVQQVLSILLDNALKASPPGGRIVADIIDRGDHVRIVVTDEGEGVAPDDVERIFERFYKGTQTSGGSGLGLAIARELMALMGGEVCAEATGGRGGRFSVILPKVQARIT